MRIFGCRFFDVRFSGADLFGGSCGGLFADFGVQISCVDFSTVCKLGAL